MRFTMDTAGLPARERFDFWQDMLNQQILPVRARSRSVHDFTGSLQASDFGAVKTVFTTSRSVDVERTPALIRRGDPEAFLLIVNFQGRHAMLQDRRGGLMDPGDMVLLHSSRSFHSEADQQRADQVGSVVMLDSSALPFPTHRLRPLVATPFSARDGVVALVSRYLHTLATGTFEPDDAPRLSSVAIDLVSLMFARRLQVEGRLPDQTRANALYARVRSYIVDRLGDPALTVGGIAAAHHLSIRSLHRLFQVNEKTVAGWIRSQRLERCRRDLLDPAFAGHTVRAIALRWGFTDAAHFTRVFKAAYGVSPATYRTGAHGEA